MPSNDSSVCRELLALFAAAAAVAVGVALGDVDSSGHVGVIDSATALRLHAEVFSNFVHVDLPRSVISYDHRPAYIAGVDTARSVALDYKRAGNVADVDIARSIVDGHVTTDVLDSERSGAVGNANRTGRAIDAEISRPIGGFERTDVENLGVAAAVGYVGVDALRDLDDQVESRRVVVVVPSFVVWHIRLDEDEISSPLRDQLDLTQQLLRGSSRSSRDLHLAQTWFALDAEAACGSLDLNALGASRVDDCISGSRVAT